MKPERKIVALTDEAKTVLDLLKKVENSPLNDLKQKAGLSNKKWDKSIKELTKNGLAKVEKTEDGLFITIA